MPISGYGAYFLPKSRSRSVLDVFIKANRDITRELAPPQPHNIDAYGMARYRLRFLVCAIHVRARSWNYFHYSALSRHLMIITLAGVIDCLPFLSTPDCRNILKRRVARAIPLIVTIKNTGSGYIPFLFCHFTYKNCNIEMGYAPGDRLIGKGMFV
jgi:hypothetical protein